MSGSAVAAEMNAVADVAEQAVAAAAVVPVAAAVEAEIKGLR